MLPVTLPGLTGKERTHLNRLGIPGVGCAAPYAFGAGNHLERDAVLHLRRQAWLHWLIPISNSALQFKEFFERTKNNS